MRWRVRERANYVVHAVESEGKVNYVVHAVESEGESELRSACGGE